MIDENEAMREVADALWVYFKPKVEQMLSGRTVKRKGSVTTAPSGGMVGVTFPFDNEISVPYDKSLSLAVGDTVWVEAPDGSPINYIVTKKGSMNKA